MTPISHAEDARARDNAKSRMTSFTIEEWEHDREDEEVDLRLRTTFEEQKEKRERVQSSIESQCGDSCSVGLL